MTPCFILNKKCAACLSELLVPDQMVSNLGTGDGLCVDRVVLGARVKLSSV